MSTKGQRLLGIVIFSMTTIFLFWYVNYLGSNEFYWRNALGDLRFEIAGIHENPRGYGSVSYRILAEIVDTSCCRYTAINSAVALHVNLDKTAELTKETSSVQAASVNRC
jgi:hypothetical protein